MRFLASHLCFLPLSQKRTPSKRERSHDNASSKKTNPDSGIGGCPVNVQPTGLWQDKPMRRPLFRCWFKNRFKKTWRIRSWTQSRTLLVLLLPLFGCGTHTSTSPASITTTPPPPQALQPLVNQPASVVNLSFLLTDGSVIFQDQNFHWLVQAHAGPVWKLPQGHLVANRQPSRRICARVFASALLADGRLVIVGGEYNFGTFVLTNQAAIYDPVGDTWTSLAPPAGWDYIGDSPSVVLPNGQFLVGRKLDTLMAVLDPATLQWTAVGSAGKSDFNAEEGWTLLPDGSVLTIDVENAPNSERYVPSTGTWVSAGSTIVGFHRLQRLPGLWRRLLRPSRRDRPCSASSGWHRLRYRLEIDCRAGTHRYLYSARDFY